MTTRPAAPRSDQHWRVRDANVAWRRVVEDSAVLDIDTSVYHGMNSTGSTIWQGIAAGRGFSELVAAVVADHPEAAEAAPDDVARFVADLLQAGLIEPDEPAENASS